jgi:hypothetical protein
LVLHFDDLVYPTSALTTRLQGLVVVRVSLDEAGTVVDATALSGHEWLIPPSLANVKKARFQPTPRRAAIVVYDFRLADGDCHTTTQTILQGRNLFTVTSCPMTVQPNRTDPAAP